MDRFLFAKARVREEKKNRKESGHTFVRTCKWWQYTKHLFSLRYINASHTSSSVVREFIIISPRWLQVRSQIAPDAYWASPSQKRVRSVVVFSFQCSTHAHRVFVFNCSCFFVLPSSQLECRLSRRSSKCETITVIGLAIFLPQS